MPIRNKVLVFLFASIALGAHASQSQTINLEAKSVVPELINLGLQPKVHKVLHPNLQKLPFEEDRYLLKINLGQMSQEQFRQVKALYSNLSQVKYDKEKNYDLVDFLPPVIQSTVNKTFQDTYINLSDLSDVELDDGNPAAIEIFSLAKNGIGFFTNCWGTTWEVLKSINAKITDKITDKATDKITDKFTKQTYILSWPSRDTMGDIFRDKKLSEPIHPNKSQFGDVIAIYLKDGRDLSLQHTATVIGKNLIFEKTDTSADDPYRLSLKSDLHKKFNSLFREDSKIQYRRFNTNKIPNLGNEEALLEADAIKILKTKAPEVLDLKLLVGCELRMGGGCNVTYTRIDYVDLVINPKTGRGQLIGSPELLNRFRHLE